MRLLIAGLVILVIACGGGESVSSPTRTKIPRATNLLDVLEEGKQNAYNEFLEVTRTNAIANPELYCDPQRWDDFIASVSDGTPDPVISALLTQAINDACVEAGEINGEYSPHYETR